MSELTAEQASDLFRAEPTRWIEVGGAAVAHRRVGAGPDVLFVHGWPVHGATFRRLLPFLADHVTCHVIDLPGAGSSRFDARSELSIDGHVRSVRAVIDSLGVDRLAVVGHDSGGLIARYAIAGDERVAGVGLVDTEPPGWMSWRFRSFLAASRLPGFGAFLGWAAGRPAVRRNGFVLGDAFADRSHLDGEFDEFFLRPLNESPERLDAAMRLIKTFERRHVDELADAHRRITAPVQLVWGVEDPFFPVERARRMVDTFPDARLAEVAGAGLFSHEEAAEAVAAALLPIVTGSAPASGSGG